MKVHGLSPGKSQRDLIAIDAILDRYNKERITFLTAINSWLSGAQNGKDGDSILAHLLSLTIDPDAEVAKIACKSINALLKSSPNVFEEIDVTLVLSECFHRASVSASRTNVSEMADTSKESEQVKDLIQEVSETLDAILRLDESSLAPSPSTVDKLISSSHLCLKISNPWIQAPALQMLAAAYRTKVQELPKGSLENILEDIIDLMLKYGEHDVIQWRSFSLFSVLSDHLSKIQVEKIVAHSTTNFSGQSHQAIASVLIFIENLLNNRSQEINVDENLLDMLCYCIEQKLELKTPSDCDGEKTQLTALQVLARLVGTDNSLGTLLIDRQTAIKTLYKHLNELNSKQMCVTQYMLNNCISRPF
jgi:hypothetical protein